jgi:plastocyanin
VPIPGDYDGDGKTDIAVYHPASGLWFVRQSSASTTFSLAFGGPDYSPVRGDFDADGKSDLAVYHEPSGLWYIRQSQTAAVLSVAYGSPGVTPVPADYDADGQSDVAVYNSSTGVWSIRQSSTGTTVNVGFGGPGFNPVNGTTPLTDLVIAIGGINGSMSYSPNPSSAQVGQRVIWRNAHSTAHTATANGGAFDTGAIAPGARSSPIMVITTGSFPYFCTIHPSMTGTLNVAP